MRYLSLLLIVFVMWWTWSVVHTPAAISEAEHAQVQTELKQVIRNYITSHLPTAKNIRFDEFWTQTLSPQSIRASFSYTFDDVGANQQTARIGIDGYAILNQAAKAAGAAAASSAIWSLDKLSVTRDHYVFLNGVTVNPGIRSSLTK